MQSLNGKISIVTGASAGIGRAAARALRAEGATVVLNARREDRVSALAAELEGTAVVGDITSPDTRRALVEACGGRVDILVNNAGYGEPGPVETVSEDLYRRQFEVNVFAPAEMIRAVLPFMRRQRGGRIVNVSSVAGRFGYPLFGWYCASKHALEGMSDALRMEVKPWGIGVSLVEPGPVETEFFDVARDREGASPPGAKSAYAPFYRKLDVIEHDLRKQATTPEVIANAIVRACTSRRPRDRYVCTAMAKATVWSVKLLPRRLLDAVAARQFHVPSPEEVE